MKVTALSLASRYVGVRELAGEKDHPLVQWWLSLCDGRNLETPDETPWCSAFVNGIAWELNLPRSKSARARSWLDVGVPVGLSQATQGWDVVILSRGAPGSSGYAGPAVRDAPGHVGFYAGAVFNVADSPVVLLGGNQSDSVCYQQFSRDRVLGVRRLFQE
jgi:uncharacterized protein (TIGR02594 family)